MVLQLLQGRTVESLTGDQNHGQAFVEASRSPLHAAAGRALRRGGLAARAATRTSKKTSKNRGRVVTKDLDLLSPWEVLDLPQSADKAKIRKRFRQLVVTEHPDKNPNDPDATEKFETIKAAYEKLMGEYESYDDFVEFAMQQAADNPAAAEYLGVETTMQQAARETKEAGVPPGLVAGGAIILLGLGVVLYYFAGQGFQGGIQAS